MAVRRIVPDLHAADVGSSRAFYVDVLGLDVAMDLGWIVTLAAPGDTSIQISVMSDDAASSVQPDVSIEVDDVDSVHASVQRLGYDVVYPLTDEPWGVRRFFVRDPGGNVLNVLSHVASVT